MDGSWAGADGIEPSAFFWWGIPPTRLYETESLGVAAMLDAAVMLGVAAMPCIANSPEKIKASSSSHPYRDSCRPTMSRF
jgi:hypothetical protein